jgi:filamentous hemagglutinin family protein
MQIWYDRISSLGFVSALTIAGFGLWQTSFSLQTIAQPIPDETLGNERSQVINIGGTDFDIDGGARRGANLFHSFQEFGVENGGSVYFLNPAGVENILSRVTGNNPSNIFGILGVFGDANLFLMNPNGIVFGPNARLDVQGSFIATTADAIEFGDQGTFSAIDPQAPPLLTVNPSAFFFNQIAPNALVNQSQTPAGTSPNGSNLFGLRVPDGESLLFVGGDIRMEGGGLVAQGGRVELGGLAEPGRIGLDGTNAGLRLIFPEGTNRSNVSLTDDARVGVRGTGGGDIVVHANRLDAVNGGRLVAGTEGDGNGGEIFINANQVNLSGIGASDIPSGLYNTQAGFSEDSGNAGTINVYTGTLTVRENAVISTLTFAAGNAGAVNITAREAVIFDNGFLFTAVQTDAVGNGGAIDIDAGSVSLRNRSQFSSSTSGQGHAGQIRIAARDAVRIDNAILFSNVEPTGTGNAGNINITARNAVELSNTILFSNVEPTGTGNAGNITIEAGSVSLNNGTELRADAFGQGNAGAVRLNALGAVLLDNSLIFSDVASGVTGDSGIIAIDAESVFLTNGSRLRSSNSGRGNAANISINARDSIELNNRASITSNLIGQGNAGDVRLTAGNGTTLAGESVAIITGIDQNGSGTSGDIIITTGSLSLTARDAVLFARRGTAGTSSGFGDGQGNSGDITITAGSLTFTDDSGLGAAPGQVGNAGNVVLTVDETIILNNRSFITTLLGFGAVGNGGDITITTGSLWVGNQSGLGTFTDGQGNAGNVQVNARDSISFVGEVTGISTGVAETGTGSGGNITITTGSLLIGDGAQLGAGTLGQGNAGNVIVNARGNIVLTNGGNIFNSTGNTATGDAGNVQIRANNVRLLQGQISAATLGQGNAGDIRITVNNLQALQGGQLNTLTAGQGRAGNVVIEATDRVLFDEAGSDVITGVLSSVASTGIGRGGDITISARSVFAFNGAQLGAITSGQGDAGNITINATDTATFSGRSRQFFSGAFSTVQDNARGDAQTIRINTGTLSVTDGARVSASTLAQGNAGNLMINARDAVIVDGTTTGGFSSGLLTFTDENAIGSGGTIRINTSQFHVSNGAIVNAQTQNRSRGGNIEVNANTAELVSGGQLITTTSGQGRAGDITLNADRISISGRDPNYRERLQEFSRTAVFNQGNNSGIFANTRSNSTGAGGQITLNSTNITLQDHARISAQSLGQGTAGRISLNARDRIQLTDSDLITAASRSSGGDILVNTADGYDSGLVILRGDSDITTNSLGNGGNITLRGSAIIAFDDSDILARSQDARGGNITLDAFFSQNNPFDGELPFDGNDRVDVNADGSIAAGTITAPDTRFVQDSLADLPESAIDTESLIASSCVVRSQETEGRFIVTGRGGLPERLGEVGRSTYSTGEVRSIPESSETSWQMGDPIVEPQGLYQLEDGQMVLSRECD